MTLEGCVVKFADTIAFIGRDLQDAREVGLIGSEALLPQECRNTLGDSNREIINTLIYDLLENSDTEDTGYISYSPDVEAALIALRQFSQIHIYENKKLTAEREKVRQMYTTLFINYLDDLEKNTRDAVIFTDFIDTSWISRNYLQSATFAEVVRDFIAGMTDRYFAKRYEEFVIPRRIEGKFR
jgi:dGTPase